MTLSIFIDPGHGPGDGCLGGGIEEQIYVWELGCLFMYRASAVFGWTTNLSRGVNEDPYLQARDNRARDVGADIIFSLHCDSGQDPKWHGASVFHVSTNSKTKQVANEIARAMPAELWSRTRGQGRVVALPDPTYTRATSVVCRYTPPAVLVEVGFLSNHDNSRYLAQEWAQERINAALMAGACKAASLYGKNK